MAGYPTSRDGKDADLEDDDFDDEMTDQLHQPQQRNAANARERARMRVLSKAFCRLKTTLPWVPPDTKLSKLDTLRLATSYIAHLRAILKLSENDVPDPSVQPVNMSWPFNFHVNWDTQTARSNSGDPASTKQDWSTCSTYPDRKQFPEQDYRDYGLEDFHGEPHDRPANQNHRNAKTRRKNNLHCYAIPRSVAHGGDQHSDSSYYKSCTYYGQC